MVPMNKDYFKMKSAADILTAYYLYSAGQLDGEFVQETEPPWDIWWRAEEVEEGFFKKISGAGNNKLELPEKLWKRGVPNAAQRQSPWPEIFRKSVVTPKSYRDVANEIIILSTDKEVFYSCLREHFKLQQGDIEFAVLEKNKRFYLLKVKKPSLWVIKNLEQIQNFRWFNKLSAHSGIYLEAGYEIKGLHRRSDLNKLQTNNSTLLVQSNSKLLNLKPKWKKGSDVILIDLNTPQIPQKEKVDSIKVVPTLRKTDFDCKSIFWKVNDREQFKSVLKNETLSAFSGYKSWFCDDGTIFIAAITKKHDRAIASVLSDAFRAFHCPVTNVALPVGYYLAPALSSERIHKLFNCSMNDWICMEQSEKGGIDTTILSAAGLCNIEDFIVLEAEGAVEKANLVSPRFKFDCSELKKKRS